MKSHFFAVIESSEMVYISELHQVFSHNYCQINAPFFLLGVAFIGNFTSIWGV